MSRDFKNRIRRVGEVVSDLRADIHTLAGKCEVLSDQIEESKGKLENIGEDLELYIKAVELLTVAQETMREGVRKSFEETITFALQHILGSDYEFYMDFGRRGNLQEVNFNVKSKNLDEAFDPIDTSGGGVIDIVSLALRVAILELQQPRVDGPLVLDESFKHLSSQNLYRAGDFLRKMSERMNRQIIMVTHKGEFVENSRTNIAI